jgi:N-methylhydantoinase A
VPKVGPQSTGAHPGPACYGRGGTEATLSDAFLVSGFLDPDRFLGGRMRLDRGLAEAAIARFGDRIGMPPHEAAESVVRVAVANMYAAFTRILSRAGVDPRSFALVAFGGAGPLVGSLLAREVGIPTVFVPRAPGTLCALGAITADILNDAVRTVHDRLDAVDLGWLAGEQRALESELGAWIERHGVLVTDVAFRHSADMRYVGQSYDIQVPIDPPARDVRGPAAGDGGGPARLAAAFHQAHERVFGHADLRAPVEIVNLRVQLRGARPHVPLAEVPGGTGATPSGARRIWLDGRPVEARVYEREQLRRGDRVIGPTIVEQPDTTVLVPAGDVADVDRFGNLIVHREA